MPQIMHSMDVSQVFNAFSGLNVVVIGDVMVDAYLFGKVDRISPEAPVPVVSVEKRVSRLGGAANVALNLKSLGVTPVLCSVIGDDAKGMEFMRLLEEAGIDGNGITRSARRMTTTKFRVIGNNMQMLRVDEEVTGELDRDDELRLLSIVSGILEKDDIHAIIFQDYDKGVLSRKVIESVIGLANGKSIPVAVDPKRRHFLHYGHVALFKPNLKELREGLNMEISPEKKNSLEEAAARLHREMGLGMVMITLSDSGVFVSERTQDGGTVHHRVPAHRRSIADVSGAGDTVVSVAAACLAAGMDARSMAVISNLAGGLVCEEVGVVPINRERLMDEVRRLND